MFSTTIKQNNVKFITTGEGRSLKRMCMTEIRKLKHRSVLSKTSTKTCIVCSRQRTFCSHKSVPGLLKTCRTCS